MTREEIEAAYRGEVTAAHAEYRAGLVALHREFDDAREITANGTWGRRSGFTPAAEDIEKRRNFQLVVAAQRRNSALEQVGD
jgi:hypothetical protein